MFAYANPSSQCLLSSPLRVWHILLSWQKIRLISSLNPLWILIFLPPLFLTWLNSQVSIPAPPILIGTYCHRFLSKDNPWCRHSHWGHGYKNQRHSSRSHEYGRLASKTVIKYQIKVNEMSTMTPGNEMITWNYSNNFVLQYENNIRKASYSASYMEFFFKKLWLITKNCRKSNLNHIEF